MAKKIYKVSVALLLAQKEIQSENKSRDWKWADFKNTGLAGYIPVFHNSSDYQPAPFPGQ
jgi:hypothetical protein